MFYGARPYYGGVSLSTLKEILKYSKETGTFLDDYFGDGAIGPAIMEDLVEEIERLKSSKQ